MIHTVKSFGTVKKAEVDYFLEFSCFFDDSAEVGNLISGFSAFSKPRLNIWKFIVHILLKSGLENFEHYITSMWDECNCAVVWAFFDIVFLWDWNENGPFQSCGHCWVFQICWHIECSTFTASSLRIQNSSTGIPSLPLALFVVMLPKAHLTSHSRMSGSRWVITPIWLSGSQQTGKFFRKLEYQITLPVSWKICMQFKKRQLESDMEQWTGSKLGKKYVKAVYFYPAYLTYMQSTSCEIMGWMKHKPE